MYLQDGQNLNPAAVAIRAKYSALQGNKSLSMVTEKNNTVSNERERRAGICPDPNTAILRTQIEQEQIQTILERRTTVGKIAQPSFSTFSQQNYHRTHLLQTPITLQFGQQ